MKRRDFIQLSSLGLGGIMIPNLPASGIPIIGNAVSQEAMIDGAIDVAVKKRLADAALNAAKSKGATYTDVRIGDISTNLWLRGKIKYKTLSIPNLME